MNRFKKVKKANTVNSLRKRRVWFRKPDLK